MDNGVQGSGEGTPTTTSGPSGPGWVIELTGFHYFSKSERDGGVEHVRNTIIKNLSDKIVMLPDADGDPRPFTMDELGIGYAVLLDLGETTNEKIINPNADPATAEGGEGEEGAGAALAGAGDQGQASLAGDANSFFTVKKYSFTLQFSWQAPLVTERLTRRNEFVTAWEDASSLEQVGPNIGMTLEQVKRRAERYRTMNDLGLANITLKDFDQPGPPEGANEAPGAPIDTPPGGP